MITRSTYAKPSGPLTKKGCEQAIGVSRSHNDQYVLLQAYDSMGGDTRMCLSAKDVDLLIEDLLFQKAQLKKG